MSEIRLVSVRDCLAKSLELLDRTYSSAAPGVGGWYHRLESSVPGPSATAVALHAYFLTDRLPIHASECLAFLKSRQVVSTDDLLDGGWAVNTSDGQPLLESTSLVVRLLSLSRIVSTDDGPSLSRGRRWIIRNRNDDGGWGSFLGQPSRTWLTAMAVRALADTDPTEASVSEGVQWLLRAREASGAWGEMPQASGTITHTSYVLAALVESRLASVRPEVATAIERGYEWLKETLDANVLVDAQARVESYNLTIDRDGKPFVWQNSVWHPSLPYALSALARDPSRSRSSLVAASTNTIVRGQQPEGNWPNADGAAGISIWSVWPYVEALSDLLRGSPLLKADRVVWITDDAVLIVRQDGPSASTPLLAWQLLSGRAIAIAKRQWASILLCLVLLTGVALWLYGRMEFKDLALALVLPIALFFVQEFLARRQGRV